MTMHCCEYCDDVVCWVSPRGWCRPCEEAQRIGGTAPVFEMAALLDRLEAATAAGHVDQMAVCIIADDWRDLKDGAA